eukprot:16728-Heterococcus_DN1.PRE.1
MEELHRKRLQDPVHSQQIKFVEHIKALGQQGEWQQALAEFTAAKQNGHFVDQGELIRVMCILLCETCVLNNSILGQADQAEQLVALMENYHVRRNLETCHLLTLAYSRGGFWHRGFLLMEDMIQNHPQPDHTILEHIIFGCGLRGHWNRARKLLTTMPTRRSLKLIPTVKTYNTAIFAHTRNGMWERSVNLLTDMKAAHLQPDAFTYMSVITACDTAKQRELALQLSAEMEQSTMHALCFNYVCHVFCVNAHQCVMCDVYHDNQAGVAPQELIDSVQQRSMEPVDLEIHTMLLQYYGIVGRYQDMVDYIEKIAQEGPAPTAVTYELAIELAQDDASIQQVLKANMASHGIKPTPFEKYS